MVSPVSLEQIDVRKLQGVYSTPFSYPSRPSFMYNLVGLYQRLESSDRKHAESLEIDTRSDLHRLQELNGRRISALRDTLQANQSKSTWLHWQNVAQYVASVATMSIGATCVATGVGVIPGWLLVGSGALGLTNRIAVDSGALEWTLNRILVSADLARKTAAYIDTTASAVSTVMALGSAFAAYHAGALAVLSLTPLDSALNGLKFASSVIDASTQVGAAFSERRIQICNAELKQLECETTLARTNIELDASQFATTIQATEKITRVLKDAIFLSTT